MLFASVQDFSVQGMALILPRAVNLDAIIEIELGAPVRFHEIRVRHATLRPDGKWHVGCMLSRLLTVDDLEKLG